MTDKNAIVTGGRRGIGAGIAIELAKAGFHVLISDIERDAAAEATLAEIGKAGGTAAFFKADVSDLGQHAGMLDAAQALPGRLSCLVNNAGITSLVRGEMLELTPESYDRVMDINLRAAFFLSQAFCKRLIAEQEKTPEGEFRSIINITSANAELLALERADYTLSKAGGSMMTRLFAGRMAKHWVNVYEIRPGLIHTDMTAPVAARYDKMVETGGIPMRRWGEPGDVGRAAAMLASGHLAYTTGEHIWVDGGWGLRL